MGFFAGRRSTMSRQRPRRTTNQWQTPHLRCLSSSLEGSRTPLGQGNMAAIRHAVKWYLQRTHKPNTIRLDSRRYSSNTSSLVASSRIHVYILLALLIVRQNTLPCITLLRAQELPPLFGLLLLVCWQLCVTELRISSMQAHHDQACHREWSKCKYLRRLSVWEVV